MSGIMAAMKRNKKSDAPQATAIERLRSEVAKIEAARQATHDRNTDVQRHRIALTAERQELLTDGALGADVTTRLAANADADRVARAELRDLVATSQGLAPRLDQLRQELADAELRERQRAAIVEAREHRAEAAELDEAATRFAALLRRYAQRHAARGIAMRGLGWSGGQLVGDVLYPLATYIVPALFDIGGSGASSVGAFGTTIQLDLTMASQGFSFESQTPMPPKE